jgi:hypothetical protein
MLVGYRFDSASGGQLDLGTALYGSLATSSEAVLIPTDGGERRIRILLEPQPAAAAFEVISEGTH